MPWTEAQKARLAALIQHDNLRHRRMSFGQYRAMDWGSVILEVPQYYEWAANEESPGIMMRAWREWCARYVDIRVCLATGDQILAVRDVPLAFAGHAAERAAEPAQPAANGPATPAAHGEPAAEPTPTTAEPLRPTAALFDRAVDLVTELTAIMEALRLQEEPP